MSRRRSTFVPKRGSWFGYKLLDLRLGFLSFLNAAEQEQDEAVAA